MSESAPAQPPMTPPTGFDPTALQPDDTSKWPKVIGVISLMYAIGGMLCSIVLSVWTAFIGAFMARLVDADVDLPTAVKASYLALGLANLVLGVMMLMGAVALLRRRQQGVKLLLRWSVARMALLLIGALINVLTATSQIDMQQDMAEAGNRQRTKNDMEPLPVPDDETLYRRHIISTAVVTGVFSIYPLFLGFYLSRRTIREHVSHWPKR